MNDIINELQALNEDRFDSIQLPDEDDLVLIEEEILLSLPRDLKEYLLQASNVVLGAIQPATVSDPQLHTHLPEITATAWSLGMERHLIAICEIPEGYFFMSPDGNVGFWSHQEGNTEQMWEDLWAWLSDVVIP